ncbi:MAG: hypothetical protein MRY79_03455 [Alphaproteobacteria bacterium]|nr:hypothetical protein [Alphaproteobacteria bacterium]
MSEYFSSFYANERTAGGPPNNAPKTIQAWKSKKIAPQPDPISATPAQKEILANLEQASHAQKTFDSVLETAAAYAPTNLDVVESETGSENSSSSPLNNSGTGYDFSDVIDAVNPLHHLPLVGYIYRGLTGDTLHPASGIIGGGIYGGPIGAVMGTVNAISQIQTGKDLGGYALSLTGISDDGESPSVFASDPEARLNHAAQASYQSNNLERFSGTALGFADFGGEIKRGIETYEAVAQGRTAGKMHASPHKLASYHQTTNNLGHSYDEPKIDLDHKPSREQITQVNLSPMPPRQSDFSIEI